MHIQDGFLTGQWAVIWSGAATVFVAKGIYDVKKQAQNIPMFKPMLGLVSAAVFFISLLPIPVPITGTSSHPCGTPLAAILVGPFVSVILSATALLLQALFFAHGGITTLGANVMAQGVIGSLAGYAIFRLGRKSGLSLGFAAGAAGFIGDLAVYSASALELALGMPGVHSMTTSKAFVTFLGLYIPTQLPLAILEGLVTGAMLTYIAKVRPDILYNLGLLPRPERLGDA
ncbi:MAG: energy-coupling factor ABC transporter permease [Thermincola sp.]|jgi:cobalt/nickel transport system permease protein|nr:energy-coupling factor ABC transporter permease [Thermincola sp.]MDT3703586.1 energy-coupling factor ABC transporter permease [Thermincola sp.]